MVLGQINDRIPTSSGFYMFIPGFSGNTAFPLFMNSSCASLRWKQSDISYYCWLLESNRKGSALKQLVLCNWLFNNVYFPRAVYPQKEAAKTKCTYLCRHLHWSPLDAKWGFSQKKINGGLFSFLFHLQWTLYLFVSKETYSISHDTSRTIFIGKISSWKMAFVLKLKFNIEQQEIHGKQGRKRGKKVEREGRNKGEKEGRG